MTYVESKVSKEHVNIDRLNSDGDVRAECKARGCKWAMTFRHETESTVMGDHRTDAAGFALRHLAEAHRK
ncbi:hypothetical protein [Streptomyces nigrescens]